MCFVRALFSIFLWSWLLFHLREVEDFCPRGAPVRGGAPDTPPPASFLFLSGLRRKGTVLKGSSWRLVSDVILPLLMKKLLLSPLPPLSLSPPLRILGQSGGGLSGLVSYKP